MMRNGQLARKRHRKTMKRRFIGRVHTRMLTMYGSYIGEQMYRTWRERHAQK